MVPALFIKSESTLDKDYTPLSFTGILGSVGDIMYGFVEAFKIKYFRKLCFTTFLIFNSFNTVAALTFFVIVYKLFNGDAGASGIWVSLFGCLGAVGTTFIVIPTVTWMAKIALPFFSFGIGSLFTIMMSMTADVIDIDELNTGKRREGLLGAIYWWMVKVGYGIAGALSGAMIAYVGFNSDLATVDQQGAVDGLHALFCFFPAAGTIIAMWIMHDYDLTEEKSADIRRQLEERDKRKITPL